MPVAIPRSEESLPNRHIFITGNLSRPARLVGEIHVAGYSPDEHIGEALLIDSHAAPVAEPVWELLETALRHFGPTPVLIERDAELPPFAELLRERTYAHHMVKGLKLGEAANA